MAWTTPKTWTVGEVLTAAGLNIHLRDNLNAVAAPAASSISVLNTLWGGGTPPDGARGVLVFGTGEVVHVTYSALFGKWYTAPVAIASSGPGFTQKSAFGWGDVCRGFQAVTGWAGAGLVNQQLRFIGEVYSDQANAFANFRVATNYGEIANSRSELVIYTSAINPQNLTPAIRESGWVNQSHGAHDLLGGAVQIQADNTGQNTFARGTLWQRFTS
jgi:hypothetical protein